VQTATILIAIGSNRRHGRHGRPDGVVRAAITALGALGTVVRISGIHATAPVGPGGRRFANAAIVLESTLSLREVLTRIKAIEAEFGRRGGQRWGDRVLDLDIIGAGAVRIASGRLQVPHPRFAMRRFVLDPLVEIAPDWRAPGQAATVRQLRFRAMRPKAPACLR
jgi:2-amino-4-hydroxy-6-hydroxymethyldihydropteridine diphosphokinase